MSLVYHLLDWGCRQRRQGRGSSYVRMTLKWGRGHNGANISIQTKMMYNPTVFYRPATRQAFRMQSRKGLQNSINSFLSANNFNLAYVHSWCWKNQISKEFFPGLFQRQKEKTHILEKNSGREAQHLFDVAFQPKNLEAITTTDMQRAGSNYFTVQLPFIIFGS